MKDDATRELEPKLRFPEFENTPEWADTPFDKFLTLESRRLEKPSTHYMGLGVRSHGKGTFLKESEDPEKISMDHLFVARANDLIVNITFAWEGAIAIVPEAHDGALVSHRFPTYGFNRDVALPDFLRYVVLDQLFIYQLGVISPGGAGRNRVLNRNDFLKLTTPLPDVDEQQKIANCLSSLDELIAAHSRKLDALKAHKKGLMQQLFPREGETLPRLRFREFTDQWIETRFAALVKESFYGTSKSTSATGEYPVLRMGNMSDGQIEFSNLVHIDLDESDAAKILLNRGDILLNRTNSMDLVGKVSMFDSSIECITASYIVAYRLDTTRVVPSFCNYFLNTPAMQGAIKVLATPSIGQANINPTAFQNSITLQIPSAVEQEKISNCLSSADDAIIAHTEKLHALERHKKGLSQQLFPSLEGSSA